MAIKLFCDICNKQLKETHKHSIVFAEILDKQYVCKECAERYVLFLKLAEKNRVNIKEGLIWTAKEMFKTLWI